MSSFIPMPEGVHRYNGGALCDMAIGPCACGAWHEAEDAIEYFGRLVREATKALDRLTGRKTPAEPGTHSVSRPDPAGAPPAVSGSDDDVY